MKAIMKKMRSGALTLIGLLTLVCTLTLQAQNSNQALRKLQMAEFAISHLYVDQVNEEQLVEEANDHGGKDNIAVVLIKPFADEVKK